LVSNHHAWKGSIKASIRAGEQIVDITHDEDDGGGAGSSIGAGCRL
jgi:hypothetical protein